MQKSLMRDFEGAETPASVKCQLAKTWEQLEERKRILRMKPLPKAQDVSELKSRSRVRAVPRE